MELSTGFFLASVGLFTMAAAAIDWRSRRLPNWLTVPAFGLGLAFHTIVDGWSGLLNALAGFAAGFAILLVLWLIGGGGGGDVKLMGALGAWLGPVPIVCVFIASAVLAALGSMFVLCIEGVKRGPSHALRKYLRRPDGRKGAVSAQQRTKRRLLPYALPVAFSTWLVLLWQASRGAGF